MCSTNITCDCTFVTFSGSLMFFSLTFDGSIVTLGSTNILFDRTFLTFGGTLILTHIWQFHHYIEFWATSYVTVLLSHLIVLLFIFSHIWWFHYHIKQYQHHIWQYFCHIQLSSCFFLTFDGTIFKLCSTKIICD